MMKTLLLVFLLLSLGMAVIVKAQTAIYRSVQPGNTSAIATNAGGTITLTISGSTATFSAALPDTIGIGCAIEYDVDNNGTVDNLAFIHERTSSTIYTVKDSLGAAPNAVTGDDAWSIFHAYTSLQNWESGVENTGINDAIENFDPGNRDISANNEVWNVCLYRGIENNGTVLINWTTGNGGTAQKINIFPPRSTAEIGTSQHHNGMFNLGYRIKSTSTLAVIIVDVRSRNVMIDGIVAHHNVVTTGNSSTILQFTLGSGTNLVEFKNCIAKGPDGSTAGGVNGIFISAASGSDVKISNCYVFHCSETGAGQGNGITLVNGSNAYVYNNTVNDCSTFGINRTGTYTVFAKNNIASAANNDFNGTMTQEYNASADATASGTGSRTNQTFSFVDATSGPQLSPSDTGAKDFGEDLSGDANIAVVDDITGTARPQGSAYDIGASEVVTASTSSGRRRAIIQSMLPPIEFLLYTIAIINIFGIAMGVYKFLWHEIMIKQAWEKSKKMN